MNFSLEMHNQIWFNIFIYFNDYIYHNMVSTKGMYKT